MRISVNIFSKLTKGLPLLFLIVFLGAFCNTTYAQKVISISINDGINPATAEYIHRGIMTSEKENAEVLIVNLNTPGGLLSSTRSIVTDIMKSKVPVIVYVSPTGAHAGSAGVFITMAANIAAMAPGTNIGAAHPVDMQGKSDAVMNEKGTNDAAAFIRSIAEKRHRNIVWAEDAVRNSAALSASEALEQNVINVIAKNIPELLDSIDGKTVEVNGSEKIINTKNVKVEELSMGWFQKILSRISDPNIAYILMMLGFFGLLFELFNPGAIFPGIVGVICLVLAFYSMSSMPVNYAGVGLIVFGIVLFLLEIKIISHGMLAIGGIISVLLGSLILFRNSPTENYVSLSWLLVSVVTSVSGLFFLFLVVMGLKAQKAKPASLQNNLIGKNAVVVHHLNPEGQVMIMGENWRAISLSGDIKKHEEVIIKNIEGFTLFVEPVQINAGHVN
ncbi:MAG: NfeD family protein [Ginsengibacter sp.]